MSSSGKIFKQKFHKIFIKSHDLVFPNFHTKESKKKRIKQLSSNQGNQKPMARTSKIFEKHLIIQNAKRFCKVQEEISRLVFSLMRLEIEMTDDDDQTIWKWFPIPELTNEPSWLVQCKKLLVKEGGFLIYHFPWSWIDKNFKDRWLSIISLARLVIIFSPLIFLAIN